MDKHFDPPLRRFIVDTDTGSDDVWAIIEALRATDVVRVKAVTLVCGNLPLDLCVKNAMLAVDAADTYVPPVYRGMERPLLNQEAFYAPDVHGEDGLGGMDTTWVTWDSAAGETEITPADVTRLLDSGDRAGAFCARCTRQLREYYRATYGRDTYSVIDSLVMTAALYPEIMEGEFGANCAVELGGGEPLGYFRIDRQNRLKLAPNATVCPAVNVPLFKKHLFTLLGAD